MTSFVTLEWQDGIGLLKIDRPPVNALSQAVLRSLLEHLEAVRANPDARALILLTGGRTFVCGADLNELDDEGGENTFNQVMDTVEAMDIPVISSMHGMALGGGLELALASHYRVAHRGMRMGLPEVSLGVLPGAGGTQRLPRLVGVRLALDMISSGKPINAARALEAGLVDTLTDEAPDEAGLSFARALLAEGKGPRRTGEIKMQVSDDDRAAVKDALEAAAKRPAYPALANIARCIEAVLERPFAEGQQLEQELFRVSRDTNTSRALRHLFFAEREAAKIPNLPAKLPLRPINKMAVIGAGTMGRGIVMNFLSAGIEAVLVETSQEALDAAVDAIRSTYESSVQKGRISQEKAEQAIACLHPTLDETALADCDLVIEAVFENMEVKTELLQRLGKICKPGAILGTNTSTLDVNVLAQASGRPADVVGLHFFSPANIMKLLEVVRGDATAPDVLATAMSLARTIGKIPVVSGVCYGFIGNRMLESYAREVDFLLMEGASPSQIDAAIQGAGLAMGPCRMLDLAGTDVAAKIVLEQEKAGALPDDPSYRAVVRELFEAGRNGQKTGRGYYRYEGRNAVDDPEFTALSEKLAAKHGITRRNDISDAEIFERCMYPLINEAALILEEGIAYRPGDIDVVWVRGYGFPDHRGGPVFMADTIGLPNLVERLQHYAQTQGNQHGYWNISALIQELAAQGKRLSDWRPEPSHS